MSEIHVNDIGTRVLVRFSDACSPLDFTSISVISSLVICFKPPAAPTKTLPATFAGGNPSLCGTVFAGDGSDGWVETTIASSAFWSEPGTWCLQGRVIGTQGDNHSEIKTFEVFANICL